jgi:hypothetical protein
MPTTLSVAAPRSAAGRSILFAARDERNSDICHHWGMPNDDEVHALSVERVIDAAPEAVFDAFIALYDSDRPDCVAGNPGYGPTLRL